MLIDEFLPSYDVRERHGTVARAAPERVYAALRSADLASAPAVRVLLALRALPGAVVAGKAGLARWRADAASPVRLADFERHGFAVLAEDPPRELLIGVEGVFWLPRSGLCAVDAASFRGPQTPGTARAAWNFTVERLDDGRTRLATETRVRCADRRARLRFRPYWLVIRPWSGLIRRLMLAAIRREAERP